MKKPKRKPKASQPAAPLHADRKGVERTSVLATSPTRNVSWCSNANAGLVSPSELACSPSPLMLQPRHVPPHIISRVVASVTILWRRGKREHSWLAWTDRQTDRQPASEPASFMLGRNASMGFVCRTSSPRPRDPHSRPWVICRPAGKLHGFYHV